MYIWQSIQLSLLLHLIPTFMCGRCTMTYTPPCSTVVHFISRQSLLFDIILYFVQPSSFRSSSLPSPLYFHFHRPPSFLCSAPLFSSHAHSWTFFVIPPTFGVPLILSFLILSSFETPHIHRSLLISANSNLFSCASSMTCTPVPPSPWSSSSCSGRTTLQTPSSSSSTHSALCGWLPHPVLHPPPTSIPCMWMSSLSLLSLPVNGSMRLDVHCTPSIQSSFY